MSVINNHADPMQRCTAADAESVAQHHGLTHRRTMPFSSFQLAAADWFTTGRRFVAVPIKPGRDRPIDDHATVAIWGESPDGRRADDDAVWWRDADVLVASGFSPDRTGVAWRSPFTIDPAMLAARR